MFNILLFTRKMTTVKLEIILSNECSNAQVFNLGTFKTSSLCLIPFARNKSVCLTGQRSETIKGF